MGEESAQKRGAKWGLLVILVTVFFAALFMLGYFTNLAKRNSGTINSEVPSSITNSNQ